LQRYDWPEFYKGPIAVVLAVDEHKKALGYLGDHRERTKFSKTAGGLGEQDNNLAQLSEISFKM